MAENIKQIVEQAKREERERIARKLAEEEADFCPPEIHGVDCEEECVDCIMRYLGHPEEPQKKPEEVAEGAES